MSTSKTGKHGHAKVHLIATDIFTSKKLEEVRALPIEYKFRIDLIVPDRFALLLTTWMSLTLPVSNTPSSTLMMVSST